MNHRKVVAILKVLFVLGFVWGAASCGHPEQNSHTQKTFIRLAEIRNSEKHSIITHFESMALASSKIAQDETMLGFFNTVFKDPNSGLSKKKSQILDSHFVHQYGSFYDLLFVSAEGFVFHSVKQENDYHTNLFTGHLSDSGLGKELKTNPQTTFVDFQPYGPSGESASFFISRVLEGGKLVGWFVLQYGSNELNAMLSQQSDLGRTGEIYLVNSKYMMLSDSRFLNESSILKLHAETKPARMAFEKGNGQGIFNDYRGIKVFSSFEVLYFSGTKWALLVEIDADEIANDFYLENKAELLPIITQKSQALSASRSGDRGGLQSFNTEGRVDINELMRVGEGESCWTAGIGPCTALVAYYPGRFGYLLHLGPTDEVYMDDPLTRIFLGTRRTDLVSNLIGRICHFDVVTNDLDQLKFVIIATHTKSLEGILDSLLKHDISLTQISFAHNANADYANVSYDHEKESILVEWANLNKGLNSQFLNAEKLTGLSSLFKIK